MTLVDAWAIQHGVLPVAKAYLEWLYSPTGQRLAAKHFYRPCRPEYADSADLARFPAVPRIRMETVFGDWSRAQHDHFDDGGIFDAIYAPGH